MEKVKCILNNKSVLGEGPVWDESRKKLFFVDIMGKKINSFDPITKEFDSIETENPVGCIVFHKDNNIISAQQNKLVKINLDTKESVKILDFNLDEYLRFNDGKCDINGRLWVGTMATDQAHPKARVCGSLFCADEKGNIKEVFDKMAIPNGIAFSSDNKYMYHIDTPTQCISRYDFDAKTGKLSNKTTAVKVPENEGSPDGMTIDCEGMLWVALWGGYAVARCNPETGEQLLKISVDAENISCCAFGGENMDELFITSAINDNGEGGELFWYQTNTKGMSTYRFGE